MLPDWMDRKNEFPTIDGRKLVGNLVPAILYKAKSTPIGQGLHIRHDHEPEELYGPLGEIGYEFQLVQVADTEFHLYCYRQSESGE